MSKTPEEKPTVRFSRTVQTNSEKPNLTPEEKAREEAETMISEYANNSHISREYYAEGYLSGYHSRDEEVKELREALKEIIQECEDHVIKQANISNQGISCYVAIDDLEYYMEQAKQLLKDSKDER